MRSEGVSPKVATARSVLDPRVRQLLERAAAAGTGAVSALILTDGSRVKALGERLAGMGCQISEADPQTGYLNAKVPAGLAVSIASLDEVHGMQLSEAALLSLQAQAKP